MARRCHPQQGATPGRAAARCHAGTPAPREGGRDGALQHGLDSDPAARARYGAVAGGDRGRQPSPVWPAPRTVEMNSPRDTWRPTATRALLEQRASLLGRARRFFAARGVLEVDTPILVNSAVTDVHIHSARVHLADASDS